MKAFTEEAAPIGPDQNLVWENDRLRRENRILEKERGGVEKAVIFFADQNREVRFH